ncbi:MAG: hypothetical protein ACRDHZ_14610, partial [Ktedonobacteraceae bacterium]
MLPPTILRQPTLLPFGSGVSASFHQAHITKRTAIHLVNPLGRSLAPHLVFKASGLGAFVPCLRDIHYLLTARAESMTPLTGEQGTERPWEVVFHSCNLLFTSHIIVM